MKRAVILGFPVLALIALALPGCQQAEQAPSAQQESASDGPDAKPGLSATGGVLVLPAVAGRPGAAYFTLTNSSDKAAELAAIHIDGAQHSEMHETTDGTMAKLDELSVAPGERIEFARGGKHVMAFDIDEDLKPGATTEMTLSFADGDKLSTPLTIEAMGDAMGSTGSMEHMDHGDSH